MTVPLRTLVRTAAIVACAGVSMSGAPAPRVLEVSDDARVLWRARVAAGDVFALSYINSHERCVWEVRYSATRDGSLSQTGTAFQCPGPGMAIGTRTPPVLERIQILNWRPARLTVEYRGRRVPVGEWAADFTPLTIRLR